ncbi:MAG: nitrite/sulfite reductase [Gammaproteobacteria bacterium]
MIDAETLVDHEEITRFEEAVQAFLNNELDADRFQSMRLQQGVYGQRQEGVNMVRVKVPGGVMNAEQLRTCANILENYSDHDMAHITTRQDFQIHYIPTGKTPAVLKDMAAAGLTSREACNNTVRNVTACPLAGICPNEHVDVTTHLDAAVSHFLRHPLTQHLPRKFKMSFSACETDCAQGMMHDVGVIATMRDGQPGFKILAGGGLGHKPRHAVTVEEFIEEKELLASMEALIALHNRYSDRKKRAKSRIKFLVDRFGADEFIEKYKEEYARTQTALADIEHPKAEWNQKSKSVTCTAGAPRQIIEQKQDGRFVFPISVPIGDLTAPQMHGLANMMESLGISEIRTTQDQNLILVNVAEELIDKIRGALAELGLGEPLTGDDVVACPGTSTCRLGITSSKVIGTKLSGASADLRIRASGCHNGCAQPETGDIGIYGEGKRKHGKLIPHYQMYLGGDGRLDGEIGFKAPTLPAARIETAIERVQQAYLDNRATEESFFHWSREKGKDYFTELLSDLTEIKEEDVADVLYDHGDEAAFKVLQLGGGECAGAAQETVAANFADAANERNYRNAFHLQRKYEESLECATEVARKVGQSLLFLAGRPAVDDLIEIGNQIQEDFKTDSTLGNGLVAIAEKLGQLANSYDDGSYIQLKSEMDEWTARSAIACQNIDSQLDLSASVPDIDLVEKKSAVNS